MESQMKYVLQYLSAVENAGDNAYLDVRPDIQARYNAGLQARLAATVWSSGCTSWYLNREGKNSTLYPGLTAAYRRVTSHFRPDDYVLVRT
jgi:hypothetical protein